jgi:Spy/CpxP family protein refolding chaperone
MKLNRFNLVVAAVLVLCLVAALPLSAQGPRARLGQRALAQSRIQPDQLGMLKRALQTAGATALTSEQETQINKLIADFRAANAPQAPDPAVQAARNTLDNAILQGQYDAAAAQVIVNQMTAKVPARLAAESGFAISIVKVLASGQVDLLVKQFGSARVVRLIESLAAGRGFGPGAAPARGMGLARPRG